MPRESKASKRRRAAAVVHALDTAYPDSCCALLHADAFQLLVATVLSAQTTDRAVNQATRGLFEEFPDPAAMAAAPEGAVEAHVQGLGLWRNKARHLRALSRILVDQHGGEVPADVDALVQLPGVGRKTATAVIGTAFGIAAGITVDTHMLRINRLLGLSRAKDPDKMAAELEALIPADAWTRYTHQIIDHGRIVCVANRPRCGVCPLAELCPSHADAGAGYDPRHDAREPASAAQASWSAREASG